MIVAFSERAATDLETIVDDLLVRASSRVAHRIVDRIEARCLSLREFPERGARLSLAGLEHLRRVAEPPYVIVYESHGDGVEIVAVLHGRRDIEAELLYRSEDP